VFGAGLVVLSFSRSLWLSLALLSLIGLLEGGGLLLLASLLKLLGLGEISGVAGIGFKSKTQDTYFFSGQSAEHIFENNTPVSNSKNIKTQKFVLANPQMCQMVGYSLEEFLKMSVPDIHPKESLLIIADQFARMAQGEKLTAQAVPLLRSDKQIIECEVSPGILEIWKQKCLVGFFRDVTDRKKAEKKLEESRSALEKQLSEINLLQKDLEASNKLVSLQKSGTP